ncbi:MAG: hypothetical protein OK439_02655 [Thaumarchaeota archaeon]|nr:hypothetical protein [Nitrososphaerota archaeon]
MDTSTIILILLILSIVGIIAVSIYSLYVEDKLLSRVESLELNLGKIIQGNKKIEDAESGVGNGIGSVQADLRASNERIRILTDELATNKIKMEAIEKELAASNARIGILANIQSVSSQQTSDRDASESNEIELLRKEISELKNELKLIETENEEIASRFSLSEEL